jgi:hypothetical protein
MNQQFNTNRRTIMKYIRWIISRKWKMMLLAGILLLALSGSLIGLIGCGGGSSGGGNSPTGPNSKACQQLDEPCWTCEDNTVRTEPACANAVACLGSEDFWQCISTTLGEYSACEQAIDRACYLSGAICSQAWESCADTACEKASFKTWQCAVQVFFQNAACTGASQCFYTDDPWTCIETALGEDSACELALDETCYAKNTAGTEFWKTCYPNNYACSQNAIQTCLTWLVQQPGCTADDQALIRTCQATGDLYSDACYQQDSATSDACWETLQSRADCQLDACDAITD